MNIHNPNIETPKVTTGPLPASRKVHVAPEAAPDLRVPLREIALSEAAGEPPLPALVPGLLVALHYVVQLLRPRMGFGSDRSGRCTPWILGGMAVLAAVAQRQKFHRSGNPLSAAFASAVACSAYGVRRRRGAGVRQPHRGAGCSGR